MMVEPRPIGQSAASRQASHEPSGGREAGTERVFEISYKLRLLDLYWMWATSTVCLLIMAMMIVVGLTLLSAVANPAGMPVDQDIGYGLLSLLLSPFFGPAVCIFVSGKIAMRGRIIRIVVDNDGISGWSVAGFRSTTWTNLRHARIESRVLVLPFSWPFADAWVVIPARAFSRSQFNHIVSLLGEKGHLQDGDHRGVLGKLVGCALDRGASSTVAGSHRRLRRFPTFKERLIESRAAGSRD
jgi:hypothetical protein